MQCTFSQIFQQKEKGFERLQNLNLAQPTGWGTGTRNSVLLDILLYLNEHNENWMQLTGFVICGTGIWVTV